jgi:hypothetical protein
MTAVRRSSWEERLAPLIEHGQWALVGHYATFNSAQVAASNLRHRKFAVPDGNWRFIAKRVADGDEPAILFARYLGA